MLWIQLVSQVIAKRVFLWWLIIKSDGIKSDSQVKFLLYSFIKDILHVLESLCSSCFVGVRSVQILNFHLEYELEHWIVLEHQILLKYLNDTRSTEIYIYTQIRFLLPLSQYNRRSIRVGEILVVRLSNDQSQRIYTSQWFISIVKQTCNFKSNPSR